MIRVTGFRWVPPFVQGYVRDVSVRWALEEAGIDYETRLISKDEATSEKYLKQQPYGQVPVYEEDDLVLFESGAIVLHIAEKSELLLPKDKKIAARVKSWMFSAMNTIDPQVRNFEQVEFRTPDEGWAKLRKPAVIETVRTRLLQLAHALGEREYFENQFSAADILMTMTLRNLGDSDIIREMPSLRKYVERCTARPAFKAAMKKHLATFVGNEPKN